MQFKVVNFTLSEFHRNIKKKTSANKASAKEKIPLLSTDSLVPSIGAAEMDETCFLLKLVTQLFGL